MPAKRKAKTTEGEIKRIKLIVERETVFDAVTSGDVQHAEKVLASSLASSLDLFHAS
jgi:hypothetical protein